MGSTCSTFYPDVTHSAPEGSKDAFKLFCRKVSRQKCVRNATFQGSIGLGIYVIAGDIRYLNIENFEFYDDKTSYPLIFVSCPNLKNFTGSGGSVNVIFLSTPPKSYSGNGRITSLSDLECEEKQEIMKRYDVNL